MDGRTNRIFQLRRVSLVSDIFQREILLCLFSSSSFFFLERTFPPFVRGSGFFDVTRLVRTYSAVLIQSRHLLVVAADERIWK